MSWNITASGHKTVTPDEQGAHDEAVKAAFQEVRRVLTEAAISESEVYITTSPQDLHPDGQGGTAS